MSWLKSFWNQVKEGFHTGTERIGTFLQSLATSASARYLGTSLTDADREANAFTANEAQKTRDWETEMSNTAYQRQVVDMLQAGVNPALMYGGSGAGGASTPSGVSASSVSPQHSDMLPALFQFLLGKKKLGQDYELQDRELGIRKYEAETRRLEVQSNIKRNNAYIANLAEVTRGLGISNDIAEGTKEIKILQAKSDLDLTDAQINQVNQGIEESSWRCNLLISQASETEARAALEWTESRLKELDINDKTIYLLYADKLYQAKSKEAYYDAEDAALKYAYDKKLFSSHAADLALKVLAGQASVAYSENFKATLVRNLVDFKTMPKNYKDKGWKQSDWDKMRKNLLDPVYLTGYSSSFGLSGASSSVNVQQNQNAISN